MQNLEAGRFWGWKCKEKMLDASRGVYTRVCANYAGWLRVSPRIEYDNTDLPGSNPQLL